jgi:uncharacterized membrane protein
MDTNLSSRLETQVGELTARVWRLEEALRRQGIVLAEARPFSASHEQLRNEAITAQLPEAGVEAPAAMATSGSAGDAAGEDEAPPLFAEMVAASPEASGSLENRIGSQWFNRIGILAVLIAMAWFLKMAIDNHWIGPLGRVLIGLLAGTGFIAWSERFRLHGYAAFSYSLKALGSSTLYLSLWAAFSLYQLLPAEAAFAAMIAVTAFNGFMAWRQDAELLAAYAIAGGLSTPLLLSTGENHEAALFSYLLLLDVAVLVLVALRPWSRLLFGAFAGTVFFFLGWSFSFYRGEALAQTASYMGCFFLLFALAPRLALAQGETEGSLWDRLTQVALPTLNAAFGFLTFLGIFWDAGYHQAGPWLAVVFAAFYLLMLNLPARGPWRESPALLSALHLATAVTFLTIAIPLKAHGHWVTIGWLAEGTALFWVESKMGSKLLQVLALICLGLGLATLLMTNLQSSYTPIFNARFGCYLTAMAALALVARWALHRTDEESAVLPGPSLAAAAVLGINLLILIAAGLEIDSFWWQRQWRGEIVLLHSYQMYAQFTYSAFFMLFGAVLLGLGFWRRKGFLRWQALVLLAATIAKVFLGDMSRLSEGYRILSFLGLGGLLLAVSFVYQRDWLHLRLAKDAEEGRRA